MNNIDIQQAINMIQSKLNKHEKILPKDKLSLIVFSGDMDKLLASFIIATGAAAMDMEVRMFFTFWATPALRDPKKTEPKKDFFSKLFSFMLPKGLSKVKLSKMNFGGIGTKMMKYLMKKKNVTNLQELISLAGELGVKIYICNMSMDLMGFTPEEMIEYPNLEYAGVATFLGEASNSKIQLFI